jgi:hypothetical protein
LSWVLFFLFPFGIWVSVVVVVVVVAAAAVVVVVVAAAAAAVVVVVQIAVVPVVAVASVDAVVDLVELGGGTGDGDFVDHIDDGVVALSAVVGIDSVAIDGVCVVVVFGQGRNFEMIVLVSIVESMSGFGSFGV